MKNILIIANAVQTVSETLDAFKFYSADPEKLDKNNAFYLEKYLRMLPTVGDANLEIVELVNAIRKSASINTFINEHNSYSLNGLHLYNFLSMEGYRDHLKLIDNIDLEFEVTKKLASWADVVILSTTFITSCFTIARVARQLRNWNSALKIIAGGAKLTQFANPEELQEAAQLCDALIVSRTGENTLLEMLKSIEAGKSFLHLPNLIYHDRTLRFTDLSPHDGADIDKTRIRWRDLPSEYLRSSANLRTGRGCPFKCKFCTFPSYNDQRLELKQVSSVVDELKEVSARSEILSIRFVDDTLFLNQRQLIDVCKQMISIGFNLPWTCYLRASTLTKECCHYLKQAGCRLVLVGIESADDTVLKNMSKGISERENWVAMENLARYEIFGFAFILVGFPGETERSIEKTIRFLNDSGAHGYVHSPMFVFPNSPVVKEAKKFGLSGGFNDWEHSTMNAQTAIEACSYVFEQVRQAAYIDRGSSISKILLDHGYSVSEAKELGLCHNEIARSQASGKSIKSTEARFKALSMKVQTTGTVLSASESLVPYSRSIRRERSNAGARY